MGGSAQKKRRKPKGIEGVSCKGKMNFKIKNVHIVNYSQRVSKRKRQIHWISFLETQSLP